MSDEFQLATGQAVHIDHGIVQVVRPKRELLYHFKMTLTHPDTTLPTSASAATYDLLVPFLKQLEAIGYTLGTIQRVEGAAPR